MTDATLAPNIPARPLPTLFRDEPVFTGAALLLLALTIPTLAAMALDTRLLQNENVWIKPFKFEVALAIYLGTLAAFARWLPTGMTRRRAYRVFAWIVALCVFAEIAWIGGAAAHGTASHFNTTSPAMGALYGAMGLAAVTLTSAALVYGVAIWRNRNAGLDMAMRTALGLGLILTFALTVIVAGYMSGTGGHFVGQPVSHAVLPIMGWSREVGDLRVAHFLATHALHVVPLAALVLGIRHRRAAWALAAGFALLTLAAFAQALAGQPLIA